MTTTSYSTVQPIVVAYSYEYVDPINLTEYISAVAVQRSLFDSFADSVSITLEGPEIGEVLSPGDWIQVDLCRTMDLDWAEHYFFGRIGQISFSSVPLGDSSGITTTVSISATTWAQVFETYVTDMRRWVLLKARELGGDSRIPEPIAAEQQRAVEQGLLADAAGRIPTLASLIRELGEASVTDPTARSKTVTPTPMAAVQLYMEMYVRFGGSLRQSFLMPLSWGKGKSIPLHTCIAKLNRSRRDGGLSRLSPKTNPQDDDKNLARSFVESGWYQSSRVTPESSAWLKYYDWDSWFESLPYYPIAKSVMTDAMALDQTRPVITGMMEWSDPGFCELVFGVAEQIEVPTGLLDGFVKCHDDIVLSRNFLPSVSLRPIPHPVYRVSAPGDETTVRYGDAGEALVKADASGYEKCTKFLLDVGSIEALDLQKNTADLRCYWMVKPEGVLFGSGGVTQFDDAAIGRATGWKIPLWDSYATNVYGLNPEEPSTKYVFTDLGGGRSQALWAVLTQKTYLSYAWTIKALDLLTGTITMPLLDHNLPRPGDVGFVVGGSIFGSGRQIEPETLGQLRATDGVPDNFDPGGLTGQRPSEFQPLNVGDFFGALAQQFQYKGERAFAFYVEEVQISVSTSSDSSVSTGMVSVSFSHGQMVSLSAEWASRGMWSTFGAPYKRFVDYSEVQIEPTFWLPYYMDVGALSREALREIKSSAGVRGDKGIRDAIKRSGSFTTSSDVGLDDQDETGVVVRGMSTAPSTSSGVPSAPSVAQTVAQANYRYPTPISSKRLNRMLKKLLKRRIRKMSKQQRKDLQTELKANRVLFEQQGGGS